MTVDIDLIEKHMLLAAEIDPALSGTALTCLKAANTSLERARTGERRTAQSARLSIASAVMAFVEAAYARKGAKPTLMSPIAKLFKHALKLESGQEERHFKHNGHYPRPEGWSGPDEGPFRKAAGQYGELVLAYAPGLPGASWTSAIAGVRCLFGDDPADVAYRTEIFLKDIEAEVLRSLAPVPPVF